MHSFKRRAPVTTFTYQDDGIIPNSKLPVVIYQRVTDTRAKNIVDIIQAHAKERKWRYEWTWRIYKFTHWHSTAHECLICIKGNADIQLGGPRVGHVHTIGAGDVVIIPAGVAHRNMCASADFTVCGLYPEGQSWDLIKGARTKDAAARAHVHEVPLPKQDPIFGSHGPLMQAWK